MKTLQPFVRVGLRCGHTLVARPLATYASLEMTKMGKKCTRRSLPRLVSHCLLSTHGCLEEMGPTSFLRKTDAPSFASYPTRNAHLTLNFCQGPLAETHSSQNHFVNVKRNQLHLEVTWLVIRSFKREPAIARFPKFRCTFQAFENLGVPQPAS